MNRNPSVHPSAARLPVLERFAWIAAGTLAFLGIVEELTIARRHVNSP